MSRFRLFWRFTISFSVLLHAVVANAAVTITITVPSGGNTWNNGYVHSYLGDSEWGGGDPVINFVEAYIMVCDPDPNVGLICVSESANITTRVTNPNGSGYVIFEENRNLPATLAPWDTTGGTYYFSVKPYNASYGPIRLNPPAWLPQLYASKTITIVP